MELRVTVQEAIATLGELLDRVNARGDTVVIEQDGRPLGELVAPRSSAMPSVKPLAAPATVRDLVTLLRASPRLDDGWAEAVEEAVRRGNEPMVPESPWDR